MRAMAYDAYGSDDVLTLRELPDPKVGPGEVRIRVRRAGVNPVDWKVMAGGLDGLMDVVFPVVPGWDVAGTVESVGIDTPEFEVGDEVAPDGVDVVADFVGGVREVTMAVLAVGGRHASSTVESAMEACRPPTASTAIVTSRTPPTKSATTSTPSGATSRMRSTTPSLTATGVAPRSERNSWLVGDAVAITRAPRALAIWTARAPTPPAPPCTSTASEAETTSRSSVCSAMSPASGRPPASSQLSASDLCATPRTLMVTSSAKVPPWTTSLRA